jgi:hypothetical protein
MKTSSKIQLSKETVRNLKVKSGVRAGNRHNTDACHSALNTQCCH